MGKEFGAGLALETATTATDGRCVSRASANARRIELARALGPRQVMVRGGAVTLAMVLMLCVDAGARAEDLSALGLTTDATKAVSWANLMPPAWSGVSLPQNWSELPFHLAVSQGAGINSNATNVQSGAGSNSLNGLNKPTAAWESVTTLQLSTKAYVYGQQFFASGTLGLNRYRERVYQYGAPDLNTNQYSGNVGMNWIYTSRCAGTLVASEQRSQSEPGQQVGSGINIVTTESFNETANCGVSSNYSAIFNSGTISSSNSLITNAANNYQEVFASAGMSYQVTETNNFQLLATLANYDYAHRQTLLNSGLISSNTRLARYITNNQVNLSYTRQFNKNLAAIVSVGIAGVSTSAFGLARTFEPQFSLSVNWAPTEKITLFASVGRVVTPPTGVIANVQTSENASFSASYAITPKVSLTGGASVSRTQANLGNGTPNTITINGVNFSQSSSSYSLRASLGYAMTPFLNSALSYNYTKSVYTSGRASTPTTIVMMTVSYAPY